MVLAVLFGFWSWLYTYKRNAKYFWIGFGISLFLSIFFIPSCGIMATVAINGVNNYIGWYFILLGLWSFGSWLWAIVDNAVKPNSFYENYPSS